MKKVSLLVLFVIAVAASGFAQGKTKNFVRIDGSSTVYPVSHAVGILYSKTHKGAAIDVKESGTNGGFERFVKGETDINDASHQIKKEWVDKCAANGVGYIEIPIAMDGICMATSTSNTFIDHLTTAEVYNIWHKNKGIKYWDQVRSGWPHENIHLYGPTPESGTYDYFEEAIFGEDRGMRTDFNMSENDDEMAHKAEEDPYSLLIVGVGYVHQYKQLKALAIDNGNGPVAPTIKNIKQGKYLPLSRKLYIYVSKESFKHDAVRDFVSYYLNVAYTMTRAAGYVPLGYDAYRSKLEELFPQKSTALPR